MEIILLIIDYDRKYVKVKILCANEESQEENNFKIQYILQ